MPQNLPQRRPGETALERVRRRQALRRPGEVTYAGVVMAGQGALLLLGTLVFGRWAEGGANLALQVGLCLLCAAMLVLGVALLKGRRWSYWPLIAIQVMAVLGVAIPTVREPSQVRGLGLLAVLGVLVFLIDARGWLRAIEEERAPRTE